MTAFSSSKTTRRLWLNIGAALDYSHLSGPRQLPTQGWNQRTQVGPSPGFNYPQGFKTLKPYLRVVSQPK